MRKPPAPKCGLRATFDAEGVFTGIEKYDPPVKEPDASEPAAADSAPAEAEA